MPPKRSRPEPDPIYHDLSNWRPKRRRTTNTSTPLSLPAHTVIENLNSRRKKSKRADGRVYGPSGTSSRVIRAPAPSIHTRSLLSFQETIQPSTSTLPSCPDFDFSVVFEQNIPTTRTRKAGSPRYSSLLYHNNTTIDKYHLSSRMAGPP